MQAVQHCWKKHRSCFDGCAGCAALLDEAFIRGFIDSCAVLIAAECVEVIEPSDAMTTATCLFDSACLSVCLVVNVAVTTTQRSVVL